MKQKSPFLSILENMPCFTKQNLRLIFNGSSFALDERIKRTLRKKKLLVLKKGLYTSERYYLKEPEKTKFKEFIAAKLRYPSYLSCEYVLAKYGMLSEAVYPLTSITVKTTRTYQNFLGAYVYFNLKEDLFFGFTQEKFYTNFYYMADKAKALFDFLYLKQNLGNLNQEIKNDLRINWENFSANDLGIFEEYVRRSKSNKMKKITTILQTLY